ncbi:MAG: LIC12162 family protein [Opitutaceae bacterium]|nr:LIC12162 family protein [Opitutaceae bacterium]
MHLIMTADERFWQEDDDFLLLGEWCKRFKKDEFWSELPHEVLPYHWKDRPKLYQDYLYLRRLNERYLSEVSERLNEIHNVDRGEKYWRIIIGPWLHFFLTALLDRYLSITAAEDHGKVSDTRIWDGRTDWVPVDFSDYLGSITDDPYNHYLYSWIIRQIQPFPFTVADTPPISRPARRQPGLTAKDRLRNVLSAVSTWVPGALNRYVISQPYLRLRDLAVLQLKLGQLPYLVTPHVDLSDQRVDKDTRQRLALSIGENRFERLVDIAIRDFLPQAYLEHHDSLKQEAMELYPARPKLILTGVSYESNEAFKLWAAEQNHRGVPFCGIQHGGLYGMGKFLAHEDHELQIYDRFYSWGWKREGFTNIQPLASGKLYSVKQRLKPNQSGGLLWAQLGLPRYAYLCFASSFGPMMLDHYQGQAQFYANLSQPARALLELREYVHDYGWDQQLRFRAMFPGVQISDCSVDFLDQLSTCRLFIGTYNTSGILETLAANFPSIFFWDPAHWNVNDAARSCFDRLRTAEILFDDPVAAANKVNEISQCPSDWWFTETVQSAVQDFNSQYGLTDGNWINLMRDALRKDSVDLVSKIHT